MPGSQAKRRAFFAPPAVTGHKKSRLNTGFSLPKQFLSLTRSLKPYEPGFSQKLRRDILNSRLFKGIAFLLPGLVSSEKGLDVFVTELDEFPCHPGTGMFLVSRSVCDDETLPRDGELELARLEDGVGVITNGAGDPVFVPLAPHIHDENRLFFVQLFFQFLRRYSWNFLFHGVSPFALLSRVSST